MDDSQEEKRTESSSIRDDSHSSPLVNIKSEDERNASEIKKDNDGAKGGLSTLPDLPQQTSSSSCPLDSASRDSDCTSNPETPCINREQEHTEHKSEDQDLDELLDSALEDFDKQNTSNPSLRDTGQTATPQVSAAQVPNNSSTSKDALEALQFLAPSDGGEGKDPFSEMFSEQASDEMAKAFEDAMKTMLSDDPNLKEQFEKLTMSAGDSMDTPESQKEFTETLTQTLAGLAKNVEDLQAMPEDEIAKMFGNMNMGDAAEGGPNADFMPMMHGMMKTLMSKEVLYPSLKELSEKYPEWLTKNKEKLDETDYKKYQSQEQIIKRICCHFEHDDENDSEESKQKRFEDIMVLMQEMQEHGQPPKEIVSEMAPGLEFDEHGLPKMPGIGGGQCTLM